MHDYRDVGGTSPWTGEVTSPRMDEVESRPERRPRTMYDCMDAGGTSPWTDEVESRLERRPRATQETKPRGAISSAFQNPNPTNAYLGVRKGQSEYDVLVITSACPSFVV